MIEIPNDRRFELRSIVCDYNGTIAKDGRVVDGVKALMDELAQKYRIYVVTADTFGSVKEELKEFDVSVKVLSSHDHTGEKADFIKELGADSSVAIGNGNNDVLMLKTAALSVALMGDEGCSKETLLNSDIVCKNIIDALELFLYQKSSSA
ncbi:MAG: haloacid dehalogenase [Helicobacteraceae bacterium 4484_230]|nr:MAG: haloacid dehalogenase [Helicobacteraceae bacterium 4484_230]